MAGVRFDLRQRSLPERIAYGVLLLAVLVLGFFFLVAALIAGALLAGVVLLRLWWLRRKIARAAEEEFITTEYTVVEPDRLDHHPARADERQAGPDPGK